MGLAFPVNWRVKEDSYEVIDEAVGSCGYGRGDFDSHLHCGGNGYGRREQNGDGGLLWAGLRIARWSQFRQSGISLAKSVTISEMAHQVGGLGDPLKVRRSAMYAIPATTIIDWAAAEPEAALLRYSSE